MSNEKRDCRIVCRVASIGDLRSPRIERVASTCINLATAIALIIAPFVLTYLELTPKQTLRSSLLEKIHDCGLVWLVRIMRSSRDMCSIGWTIPEQLMCIFITSLIIA